jgi:hypothetical protein
MGKRRAVSLAFELAEIHDAIIGVQMLAQRLQEPNAGYDAEHAQTVASALAGLAMVSVRLKVVAATIRNEVDPATLLAPHNAVPGDHEHPDVQRRPWSPDQVAANARQVAQLADCKVRGGRRGRR